MPLPKGVSAGKAGTLTVDTKEVFRNLDRLDRSIMPELLKQGLMQAALQLYDDSVKHYPRVPRKEGPLRASASAFVQNELVKRWGPEANDSHIMNIGRDEFIAVLGFNMEYAERQHEHQYENYTTPGTGSQYLRIKLETFAKDYIAVIVRVVKRGLAANPK